MAVRGVRSSWETLATNSVRTCSRRRSSVMSWRMMTTPGSSPVKRRGTACTCRTRSGGSGSLISRLTTRSTLRITSRRGRRSTRVCPRPKMPRAPSFSRMMWSWPSVAMTPSTMASRMAVALACSRSRSSIFSRRRPAMTLRERPSVPISSGERTEARTRKLPSLIWRATSSISTTGRVTLPATKSPMPSATTRATAPPASMTPRSDS